MIFQFSVENNKNNTKNRFTIVKSKLNYQHMIVILLYLYGININYGTFTQISKNCYKR